MMEKCLVSWSHCSRAIMTFVYRFVNALWDLHAFSCPLALSAFESLTEFTLSDFKIDGDGAASQLIHSLGGNPGLNKLCFNHTSSFVNNQVIALSNMLQHPNFNFTTLELSNNNINPAGWQAIFATLEDPTCRLQKLVLSNIISDDTMLSLLTTALSITPH